MKNLFMSGWWKTAACLRQSLVPAGIFILLLASAAVLPAHQWPDNQDALSSSFGTAMEWGFARGIEFAASGDRVYAWGAGEVVWTSSDADEGLTLNPDFVVLEHPDGFRSAYRHVAPRPDMKETVKEGEWLGYSGDSGWTFTITDVHRKQVIDPVKLLPVRSVAGESRLGAVELVRRNHALEVVDGMEVPPGLWSVVLDVEYSGSPGTVPMEISLYWLGERAGYIRFDSLTEQDGRVLMAAPEPAAFNAIYDARGYLVFQDVLFNAGRGILELRIKDEQDNVRLQKWNLVMRNGG